MMLTKVEEVEATKFELRNYERRVWNAKHTLDSNRRELKAMIRAGEGGGRVTRQEECCLYWQDEIDKVRALMFKICLKTGLTSGWGLTSGSKE